MYIKIYKFNFSLILKSLIYKINLNLFYLINVIPERSLWKLRKNVKSFSLFFCNISKIGGVLFGLATKTFIFIII